LNSSHKDQWIAAIRSEVDSSLIYTLIPISSDSVPPSAWIVPTTIQLKIKRKSSDATIDKFKARICLRGDLLISFFSKDETYAPTISMLTLNTIFQLSIIMKFSRSVIDQVSAFLAQDYPYESKPLVTYLQPSVAKALSLDPSQFMLFANICMELGVLEEPIT
jgi:hypothetical protein